MGCIPVDITGPPAEPTYYANLSPTSLTLRPGQPGRFLFNVTSSDRQGSNPSEVNKLVWSIENAPAYPVGTVGTAPGENGTLLAIKGDFLSPSSLPEGVSKVTFAIRARYGPAPGSGFTKVIETTSQVTLDVNAPVSPEQVP